MNECLSALKQCLSWAEPVSWLGAVVGLVLTPVAVILAALAAIWTHGQLAILKRQLTQAELAIGFVGPYASGSDDVPQAGSILQDGRTQPNPNDAGTQTLRFSIKNLSQDRTARGITLTFVMPSEVHEVKWSETMIDQRRFRDKSVRRKTDGSNELFISIPPLNPAMVTHLLAELGPTGSLPSIFIIEVTVSQPDMRPSKLELSVHGDPRSH
jgi:hypothetical protein